ncbi:phage scaffolding protein [Lacticaseibacillus pabuli]|uniref:Phage scaffolding protein n=1 Tax=Lacticaseibacillus pabuli TaxID=3025672 RepID=A0ABY7WTY9_9LACO|nr:phage scaffolding protein [Lacticaseibacillus sp. KACC 23028]WDF83627.1 phage scaffolding protein [Lacticaseibacillus sp. KACC 23028]
MITREELQKLELSDDQITAVMKLRGEDAKAAADADKYKQQVESLTTENSGLQDQLSQRDKDLKSLKKSAADSEELTTKLNDLQTKYDTDTENFQQQIATTKLNAALVTGLAGSGARDVHDLQKFLDTDDLKLSDDGKVVGLDDQVKALRDSKPYLFTGEPKPHYEPNEGGHSDVNIESLIKNSGTNLTEALEQQKGE